MALETPRLKPLRAGEQGRVLLSLLMKVRTLANAYTRTAPMN